MYHICNKLEEIPKIFWEGGFFGGWVLNPYYIDIEGLAFN